MPRTTTTRPQPVDLAVAPRQPELPQVVARPVNVMTPGAGPSQTDALVEGLAGFYGPLRKLLNDRQAEKVRKESERAQADAISGGAHTYGDALQALSPDSPPWVQEAYIATVGSVSGADYGAKLLQHAEENFDLENTEPGYGERFVADFFKEETAGLDDPAFLETFTPAAARANAQFLASNQARLESNVAERKVSALQTLVSTYFDQGRSKPGTWLEDVKTAGRGMRLAPMAVENMAFDMAATRAIEDGDPVLLEIFKERTADNQASFYEREGAKYLAAYAAAIKAAKGKQTDASDAMKLAAAVDIKTRIAAAEDGLEELDTVRLLDSITTYVDQGAIEPVAGSSYYMDGLKALRKYRENVERVGAMLDGTYAARTGDTAAERETALRMAAKHIYRQITADANIPEEQKPAMIAQRIVEVSIRNRQMNPDHLGALKLGFAATPVSEGKIEKAPQAFLRAQGIGFTYWKLDPLFFREAFGENKEMAMFYDRFYENLSRDANKDVEAAYLAARSETIASGKNQDKAGPPTGMSGQEFTKLVRGVHSDLTDSTSWWQWGRRGKPSFETDVYAQSEIARALNEIYTRVPTIAPQHAREQARKDFAASHRVVNGEWLNISSLASGMDDAKVHQLEEALEKYKPLLMDRTGIGTASGDTSISLSPQPRYITPDGPLFEVFLDGTPTGQRVLIDEFLRQHATDRHITAEVRGEAQKLLALVDGLQSYPGDDVIEAVQRKLSLMHEAGVLTGPAYKERKQRLDGLTDRNKAETVATQAATTSRAQLQDPLLQGVFKTPITDEELFVLSRPNRAGGERAFDVARNYVGRVPAKPKGADYRATMAASASVLAAGFSEVAYDNNGRQLIGAGYDLGQKDDVIVTDLIRSGIVSEPAIGALDIDLGGPTPSRVDKKALGAAMLRKMRRGEFKLTEEDSRRLLSVQMARIERAVFARKTVDPTAGSDPTNVLPADSGVAAWEVGSDHTRAALVVLYMHSKSWPAQLEAMKAGDWQRVEANLKVADKAQAMAAIRKLATDPIGYRAYLTNN